MVNRDVKKIINIFPRILSFDQAKVWLQSEKQNVSFFNL